MYAKKQSRIRHEWQAKLHGYTKWKVFKNQPKPTNDDLRQLYVYLDYFGSYKAALVYPGKHETQNGKYYHIESNNELSDKECVMIFIPPKTKDFKEFGTSWTNVVPFFSLFFKISLKIIVDSL